jgi:hypothetical protein
MAKWLDALGTIATQFQIGIGGTGLRRLRFRNGFNGDLEWNPTANRVITLPNASGIVQVTGNEVFVQPGKPTTRSDGSALQNDDRWFSTADRLWFYRSGSFWLSETLFTLPCDFGTLSAGIIGACLPTSLNWNIVISDFSASARFLSGTYDADNNWKVQLIRNQATTVTTISTLSMRETALASAESGFYETNLNLHYNVSSLGILYFRIDAVKTGNPPNIERFNALFTYRLAKP